MSTGSRAALGTSTGRDAPEDQAQTSRASIHSPASTFAPPSYSTRLPPGGRGGEGKVVSCPLLSCPRARAALQGVPRVGATLPRGGRTRVPALPSVSSQSPGAAALGLGARAVAPGGAVRTFQDLSRGRLVLPAFSLRPGAGRAGHPPRPRTWAGSRSLCCANTVAGGSARRWVRGVGQGLGTGRGRKHPSLVVGPTGWRSWGSADSCGASSRFTLFFPPAARRSLLPCRQPGSGDSCFLLGCRALAAPRG